MGVTTYRCQIQTIIKKRKMFEIFELIYFKKPTIKKVLIKLRVLSDDCISIKRWFNKQAPQKVLIELSPGVGRIIRLQPGIRFRHILPVLYRST